MTSCTCEEEHAIRKRGRGRGGEGSRGARAARTKEAGGRALNQEEGSRQERPRGRRGTPPRRGVAPTQPAQPHGNAFSMEPPERAERTGPAGGGGAGRGGQGPGARDPGHEARTSAWSLPLWPVRPPCRGQSPSRRPRARGRGPPRAEAHRGARCGPEPRRSPPPAFREPPRSGLFTTQTYNLHIFIPPVISPSELRRHKTRGAWQRDPQPTPPPRPQLPQKFPALLHIIAWTAAKNN